MTLRPRCQRLIAFLRARLSSEGLFGLHLTIGSVALVGSAWLFGGVVLNLVLKMAFARARPGWGSIDLPGYSFPSGHTMTATLLYGLLGVFFVLVVKSWWWRAIAVALVFMIISAVGFSRIYLGAHFFSDVVAAVAAGAAWLAICLTAVETLRRHRQTSSRRARTE